MRARRLPPGTTHANYPRPEARHLAARHPAARAPRRLGRDVRGAHQGGTRRARRQDSCSPWIDNYAEVRVERASSASGTARSRAIARCPNTLWLDDLYMSVPCLAQAGQAHGRAALLRRRGETDPAVRRSHVREGASGLFMHAWVAGHGASSGVPLGARQWLGDHGDGGVARGAARGPSRPGADPRAVRATRRGAHRHAGSRRPVAPVARPARVVRGDLGERDVRVRASRAASIAAGSMR